MTVAFIETGMKWTRRMGEACIERKHVKTEFDPTGLELV